MTKNLAFFTALACALAPAGSAEAARTPDAFQEEQGLILADSTTRPRRAPLVRYTAPKSAAHLWAAFQSRRGGRWTALWDRSLEVPIRIYGSGVSAPGANEEPDRARDFALQFLRAERALLAPGLETTSFVEVSNVQNHGVRVVAFLQYHRGYPVLGGQLSFRFKHDRLVAVGSEARPGIVLGKLPPTTDPSTAKENAANWIAQLFPGNVRVDAVTGPVVLPIISDHGVHYRWAHQVTVNLDKPVGRFEVFVDPLSNKPFARQQTLHFFSAGVHFNTPDRYPGGTRSDKPAAELTVDIAGERVEADAEGRFDWPGSGPVVVEFDAVSAKIRVADFGGERWTETATVQDGELMVFDYRDDEAIDAQLNTFVAAERVLHRVREIAPHSAWLSSVQVEATVNIDGQCNAYSDGTTINFFKRTADCENTGRIPDVVYHEFGHSVHAHAIIRGAGAFDSALSEAMSDYLAADITGDPGMGRGFFFTEDALRHLDDPEDERRWPDNVSFDPHETGLILGGALWDLRKILIDRHGEEEARKTMDAIYYQILERASSIPTAYAEALVADDDDGDLSNGSPHFCAIAEAFGEHGLADSTGSGVTIGAPVFDGQKVSVAYEGTPLCPELALSTIRVTYGLRGEAKNEIALVQDDAGFSAALEGLTHGHVLEYRIEYEFATGTRHMFPDNAADPFYQHFIGEVIPLYCTDFESDPFAEGWTHTLVDDPMNGTPDSWQWGAPTATQRTGDPGTSFSGASVVGTGLGIDGDFGRYPREATTRLVSPRFDLGALTSVRLQYRRWLNVQNGYYDKARIYGNDQVLWTNLDDGATGNTDHLDAEWRFHDVDLLDAVVDNTIQVTFEIEADRRRTYGGWTIDDVCIVTVLPPDMSSPDPVTPPPCDGEDCAEPLTDPTTIETDEGGCSCQGTNLTEHLDNSFLLILAALPLVLLRRRRTAP